MKKKIVALIALMVPFLFTGCFSDKAPADDSNRDADNNETAEIEIAVENALDYDIEEIWIDPSDQPWTENLLDEKLEPGDEFTIIVTEETNYDIQIIDEDGGSYTYLYQAIDENGFYLTVTEDDSDWATGGEAIVVIENNLYNESIWYCYCSSSSSDDWGFERLDYMVLEPNESFEFTVIAGEYYDLYARNDLGDFYFSWDTYIDDEGYLWSISSGDLDNTTYYDETHGETAPISFINRLGSLSITMAFGDESGGEYWGEDKLSGPIEPTEEFTFYVEADMFYDFQVEDELENIYTLWEVAVKDNGIFWEITPDDIDE